MATEDRLQDHRKDRSVNTSIHKSTFVTSDDVTKKKPARDISIEPEMIELKRMIRDGELDASRLGDMEEKANNPKHNYSV